jgi:hypothetical protein
MTMNRRDFYKNSGLLGLGLMVPPAMKGRDYMFIPEPGFYKEESKSLPVRHFDVVIAGAGTAGVIAAIASARLGASTILVEAKGYPGGTAVEGGTALHSFYNLWKAFPGVEKKQLVKGIPAEMVDRLTARGGATGYAEMFRHYDYDSVCTAIDTEKYKLNAFEMLDEAGVYICVNTLLAGVIMEKKQVKGVILESRSGREAIFAKSFVDCTGYGDLAAHAGAAFTEPNDYPVVNSMGLANVDIERYYHFLASTDSVGHLAYGLRSGVAGQIVRIGSEGSNGYPDEFVQGAREIGMSAISTTVHDDYLMFIKLNLNLPQSPTDRDTVARAELELRKRMQRGVELFNKYIPGFERAFISRTSPNLVIRRGRLITCDYDITHANVLNGDHFDDDVFVYGFHDMAPRFQVKDGGSYGFPYRALVVKGTDNMFASGMMITSDHNAHMSTRNTVCCMGQGQASGTAAALCALNDFGTRELPYQKLREALESHGVYFER